MALPAEALQLYQQPGGRQLLLATYLDQSGPQPALQLAQEIEQLYVKSGELTQALDASDLYVLGAAPARASGLLARIAVHRPPEQPDDLMLVLQRLAGARVALRLGPDFPSYLIDLSMRIGAPATERDAAARAGAFLQLNSLTDMQLLDLPALKEILGNAGSAVQFLSRLWGQCVIQGGSVGALLKVILTGRAPPDLVGDVMRKQTFLTQAIGGAVPAPSAPEARWARVLINRAGLEEGRNPFTPLHLVGAAPSLDEALAELEAATRQLPSNSHLWAAKANTRLHRLLKERVKSQPEIAAILGDVKRALAVSPNHIQALMVRGAIEADHEKNAAAAIATYESILRLSPADPLPMLYRAVNRARRGDPGVEKDAATAKFLLGQA